jgi:nucleolar pre-ribosomal-associated protein 1
MQSLNLYLIAAPGISRATSAYELSDWLRLTDSALHSDEVDRLISTIDRFHPPALKEFLQNLDPGQGSLWDVVFNRPTLLNR